MARPDQNFPLILIPAMLVQALGAAVCAFALATYSGVPAVTIGLAGAFLVVLGSLLLVWGASIYCAIEDNHPAWAFLGLLNLPGLIVLLALLGLRRKRSQRGFEVLPPPPTEPDAARQKPSSR